MRQDGACNADLCLEQGHAHLTLGAPCMIDLAELARSVEEANCTVLSLSLRGQGKVVELGAQRFLELAKTKQRLPLIGDCCLQGDRFVGTVSGWDTSQPAIELEQ